MPGGARPSICPREPARRSAAIPTIERPHSSLWTYYLLTALVIPPLFPILVLPLWFRYSTIRYKFTVEGILMSRGLLFRRETIVNYARIQDIQLRSNFAERWLGLARVLVQTASGNASAELTIEGVREFEELRDFLYSRMRGVKDHLPSAIPAPENAIAAAGSDELAAPLRETAAELRALRADLARRPPA